MPPSQYAPLARIGVANFSLTATHIQPFDKDVEIAAKSCHTNAARDVSVPRRFATSLLYIGLFADVAGQSDCIGHRSVTIF